MSDPTDPLEKAIGHRFANPALLHQALTHPSLEAGVTGDNERLEFLGDAILGFIVAAEVYRRYPELSEGELDRMRATCVNGRTLAARGREIGLHDALRVSPAEMANNPERSDAMVENAFEAIVGAVFLDGGVEAAERLVHRVLEQDLGQATVRSQSQNPKGRLQELFQAQGKPPPEYALVDAIGPDHARHYTVKVSAAGKTLGRGSGSSRKTAESKAAEAALENLQSGEEPVR